MGTKTKIEWTDTTWNPILGCSRVSEGCRNCYAEQIAGRFGRTKPGKASKPTVYSGLTQITNGHPVWTGKIVETRKLLEPLSWRKPRRVFVNSMSDLFHENVTDQQRDRIFAVMALSPRHTFQVLTKRPSKAWDYFFLINASYREAMIGAAASKIHLARTGMPVLEWSGLPMPNVLLGFSAEDQGTFDSRWNTMGRLAVYEWQTFASLEPLLGSIDMGKGRLPNWVICGGESGSQARPMHPAWARSLRDQCKAAGVPFFFKQWGEWKPSDGYAKLGTEILFEQPALQLMQRARRKEIARLDGEEWKQYPLMRQRSGLGSF